MSQVQSKGSAEGHLCHPREGGDPGKLRLTRYWIPAFAGMTSLRYETSLGFTQRLALWVRALYSAWFRLVFMVLVILNLSCAVHKAKEDVPPPVSIPERFNEPGREGAATGYWWETFGDPELNNLACRALTQNFDLLQAWDRLEQARALAGQAASSQWPEITFEAGASRSRSLFSGGQLGSFALETDRIPVSLGAAYEVDIWKRIASLKKGALLDMEATRQDLESIAMTLSARTAETWFSFLEEGAQVELLNRQMETNRTFLDLTTLRFSQGLASALDVYQQRQQLASTRAQIPQAESRCEVLRHELAVLVGEPSLMQLDGVQTLLPDLPPFPDTGIPSDLLKKRPDVRVAQLRLAAADHRVAAAVADRFPAVRIGGDTGFESRDFNEIENLFDNWIWNVAASLTLPVFDGGRRKAEVERTKAVVQERLHAYGQVVLRALQEVEDALVKERKQEEYLLQLENQVNLAQATLREARMRYVNGLSDFLPVLTALQSLQQLERSRLTAKRLLLSFRVQLYRALGGDWTKELVPPEGEEALKEDSEVDP